MNQFILIAHGAWFQTDGQDRNGNAALYELPDNLKIRIYDLQNKSILVSKGLMLLNELMRKNGELNLVHGENIYNDVKVFFKEFAAHTPSSLISNYSIGGDNRNFTGLYAIPNTTPIVPMDENFHSHLVDIINGNNVNGILHLICCQNFN